MLGQPRPSTPPNNAALSPKPIAAAIGVSLETTRRFKKCLLLSRPCLPSTSIGILDFNTGPVKFSFKVLTGPDVPCLYRPMHVPIFGQGRHLASERRSPVHLSERTGPHTNHRPIIRAVTEVFAHRQSAQIHTSCTSGPARKVFYMECSICVARAFHSIMPPCRQDRQQYQEFH